MRVTPTGPSPSTPWAPATWPRRPAASGPTWCTCRPTTSSTARRRARTGNGTRTNPMSVYGHSKLAGEHELDPGSTVVRTSWVCGAHGANMVAHRPAPGRGSPARCASSTTSGGAPPSPPIWPARWPCWPPSALPGIFHVTNSGRDLLVRVRPGRPRGRPATTRTGASPSPPPSSTRPARRPGRPTRPSTTPRSGSWAWSRSPSGATAWSGCWHGAPVQRAPAPGPAPATVLSEHGAAPPEVTTAVIGAGYVGLTTAVVLTHLGYRVGLRRVGPRQGADGCRGESRPSSRTAWATCCAPGSTRAGSSSSTGATAAVRRCRVRVPVRPHPPGGRRRRRRELPRERGASRSPRTSPTGPSW